MKWPTGTAMVQASKFTYLHNTCKHKGGCLKKFFLGCKSRGEKQKELRHSCFSISIIKQHVKQGIVPDEYFSKISWDSSINVLFCVCQLEAHNYTVK